MANETIPPSDAPAGTTTPPAGLPTNTPAMDAKEIDDGKTFAILSYVISLIGLPFFIVPLVMRNNDFALYHAKQCLMLWIAGAIGGAICSILSFLCIGFLLIPVLLIGMLVLEVMGILNAVGGKVKPLPIIGKWGEEWFKGLRKA